MIKITIKNGEIDYNALCEKCNVEQEIITLEEALPTIINDLKEAVENPKEETK